MTYSNYRVNRNRLRNNPYHNTIAWEKWAFAIVLLLIAVFGFVGCRAIYQGTETTVTTVITGKENVCKGTSDGVKCEYLVFTEDGTFKLTDSTGLLSGTTRFRTSDVYGRIKEGPATLTVMGWRIGVLSEYPNIIEIEQGK